MPAHCDVDLLAGVPLFSDLSAADLKRIATVAKRMRYREGAVVVEEGSTGGRFFVIQSGTARVVAKGRARATLGPGAYFGELSVLDGEPRTATVVAAEPLEVWSIADFNFRPLLKDRPALALKLLAALTARLRRAENSLVA
jgi:CRP-like cAMP-binding protein